MWIYYRLIGCSRYLYAYVCVSIVLYVYTHVDLFLSVQGVGTIAIQNKAIAFTRCLHKMFSLSHQTSLPLTFLQFASKSFLKTVQSFPDKLLLGASIWQAGFATFWGKNRCDSKISQCAMESQSFALQPEQTRNASQHPDTLQDWSSYVLQERSAEATKLGKIDRGWHYLVWGQNGNFIGHVHHKEQRHKFTFGDSLRWFLLL